MHNEISVFIRYLKMLEEEMTGFLPILVRVLGKE